MTTPFLPEIALQCTGRHLVPKGTALEIQYDVMISPWGELLVATSATGLCYLGFYDGALGIADLKRRFPDAILSRADLALSKTLFTRQPAPLVCHLAASAFQLQVWRGLCAIPFGTTTSYGALAAQIGKPRAVRAVATAIGQNPISLLIPCHRVLRSDGSLGGYMWGLAHKKALLAWESETSA